MRLEDALEHLSDGRLSQIYLAALEHSVAVELGAPGKQEVILSRKSYLHIRDVHPEITIAEFELLPGAIRNGLIIVEISCPRKSSICYQSPHSQQRYVVAIHGTKNGEIYCSTFHRARARNTKSKLKRGRIIRPHKVKRAP